MLLQKKTKFGSIRFIKQIGGFKQRIPLFGTLNRL